MLVINDLDITFDFVFTIEVSVVLNAKDKTL